MLFDSKVKRVADLSKSVAVRSGCSVVSSTNVLVAVSTECKFKSS